MASDPTPSARWPLHLWDATARLSRVASALDGARRGLSERLGEMNLGEPGFLGRLVRRRKLESVFLFVTARCNSRCRTCFYAGEMDKGPDMSSSQIRRLVETAPPFDKLWLSGGEPILRPDLVDIVTEFHRRAGVKTVNFPTNGLATDLLEARLEALIRACPDLNIHLNFSIDGLGDTHDSIRGVRGSFARTLASLDRIEQRFGQHPRLHLNAATVVTREALPELRDLGTYLFSRNRLATQFFEAWRGEPRDDTLSQVSRAELQALHRDLMPLYESMAERLFGRLPPGPRHLATLYFLGTIRLLYDLQEENLEGPAPWGMDCTAGQTTLVVDHEGSFRACELRPPIGHLADFDYDLGAAFRSQNMRQEVAAIGGGHRARCFCTHTCFLLSSIKFSPATLLVRIPRAYARYRRARPPRQSSPGPAERARIAAHYGLRDTASPPEEPGCSGTAEASAAPSTVASTVGATSTMGAASPAE